MADDLCSPPVHSSRVARKISMGTPGTRKAQAQAQGGGDPGSRVGISRSVQSFDAPSRLRQSDEVEAARRGRRLKSSSRSIGGESEHEQHEMWTVPEVDGENQSFDFEEDRDRPARHVQADDVDDDDEDDDDDADRLEDTGNDTSIGKDMSPSSRASNEYSAHQGEHNDDDVDDEGDGEEDDDDDDDSDERNRDGAANKRKKISKGTRSIARNTNTLERVFLQEEYLASTREMYFEMLKDYAAYRTVMDPDYAPRRAERRRGTEDEISSGSEQGEGEDAFRTIEERKEQLACRIREKWDERLEKSRSVTAKLAELRRRKGDFPTTIGFRKELPHAFFCARTRIFEPLGLGRRLASEGGRKDLRRALKAWEKMLEQSTVSLDKTIPLVEQQAFWDGLDLGVTLGGWYGKKGCVDVRQW